MTASPAGGPIAGCAGRTGLLSLAALLAWFVCGIWNSVKPMPPGTHVASLPARIAESQVDFIDDSVAPGATLKHELAAVGRADQLIVLDDFPLEEALAAQLLARKRQRPHLKIVLVTDPRPEVYGGTPAAILRELERSGVIVARTRLERLRDSDPLYSGLWRLTLGWWSEPFDDTPDEVTLGSRLRMRNRKADERHVLLADDGTGGWTGLVMSGTPRDGGRPADVGVEIRGHLARAIGDSELQIAKWSVDDERLPAPPPVEGRGVGTIDARYLTEGAIEGALEELAAAAGTGDSISLVGRALGDRALIEALSRAAARGASLRVLLDPDLPQNRAVAAELMQGGARNVEVRWQTAGTRSGAGFVLLRHLGDAWLDLGAANFTRRGIDDLNLTAAVELHLPARAEPARAAADFYSRQWSRAAAYDTQADGTEETYWRYRLSEATGLSLF